jgi:CRISPR-associated endonuclease/helicase Cas3
VSVPVGEARQAFSTLEPGGLRRLVDGATLEDVAPTALRPGDIVVLGPEAGLYDRFGWDPSSTEVVLDVSPLRSGHLLLATRPADGSQARSPVLDNLAPGWHSEGRPVLAALCNEDEGGQADDELVAELKRLLLPSPEPAAFLHSWLERAEWEALVGSLASSAEWWVLAEGQGDQLWLAPSEPRRRWQTVAVRTEAFDELSFSASSHELGEHLGAVGEMAARLGAGLGLGAPLVAALKMAGEWHDAGKADRRFQRQLDPYGDHQVLLAKSGLPSEEWERARTASGWPKGGRHELLSTRLLEAWLAQGQSACEDTDLVLHLVSSHHGWGRPMPATVDEQRPSRVTIRLQGSEVSVSGDLSLPDWDQPGRFRRLCERYGYWGLALMEAVLRQADMAVSSFTNVEGVA